MNFEFVETVPQTYKNRTYTHYRWKNSQKLYFRNYNPEDLYFGMLNKYFQKCSQEEITLLLRGEHYLRMKGDCDESQQSWVQIVCLDYAGLNNPDYAKMLKSCPPDVVPLDMYIGPFWYLFGINRGMIMNKHIVPGLVFPEGYIMGLEMYGRDAYPGETEEQIIENEKIEKIFIVRGKQPEN